MKLVTLVVDFSIDRAVGPVVLSEDLRLLWRMYNELVGRSGSK